MLVNSTIGGLILTSKRCRLEERSLVLSELIKVLSCSWANLLLIFVPVGLAVNYTHQSPLVIFAINFVAIVGPSALLEFSVTEIQR